MDFLLEFFGEGLVQQRLLQRLQRGELPFVTGLNSDRSPPMLKRTLISQSSPGA